MSKRWLLGAVVVARPGVALAQDWPSGPISMVVENVGGGGGTLGGQRDKWGAAIRAGGAIPK